jgi:hypothetical protein
MVLNFRIRVRQAFQRFGFLFRPARTLYRNVKPMPREITRSLIKPTRTFGFPRGFYSGIELLRSGAREGRVILESQMPPKFEANTLVKLSRLDQDKNQPWPVFWFLEKNAYLSGTTLCLRNDSGRLLAESTFSQTGYKKDPAYAHFATRPDLTLSGNVTSIIGYWGVRGYFHTMMDAISRLALLPEFPPDTKILVPPLAPRPWWAWFLREMGLLDRCIETTSTAVQIENYYFSAPSSMTGCWNPFAVDFIRKMFLPKATAEGGKPKRFYIVREGFTRAVENDKEVREFFLNRGWALVAPEKLTIPQQIELFSKAEAVVGLHGSALGNLLWCSPGCTVIELNPDNFLAGAFEIVARILNVHHDFIVCPGDHRSHITVDLATLDQKLAKAGL